MAYYLYHYFEKEIGPFKNLSKLSMDDATKVSNQIKKGGKVFASRRNDEYLMIRRELERTARDLFISKGGKPVNTFPHYMTLGACSWLQTWYLEPGIITIDWNEIAKESMSFTYGDLFPTMRYPDEKPYRKQVYTKDEIIKVIDQFGLPQDWNYDGAKGPERYIEVQIWDEQIIQRYM
ncbi:hypothetical protein [Paenibacillus sanfengchensis]|uniref:hypothetical protein n=1 Tax=Paenibacillus sanfengchensis TaxID=3119819 RepID=UPI002FE0E7A1